MKDFGVKVQRGNKVVTLPIRAPNKEAAEEHAALIEQRRTGKKPKVIGATEKK